jgi:hypothetical protein
MKINDLNISDKSRQKLELFLTNTNLSIKDQSELLTIINYY